MELSRVRNPISQYFRVLSVHAFLGILMFRWGSCRFLYHQTNTTSKRQCYAIPERYLHPWFSVSWRLRASWMLLPEFVWAMDREGEVVVGVLSGESGEFVFASDSNGTISEWASMYVSVLISSSSGSRKDTRLTIPSGLLDAFDMLRSLVRGIRLLLSIDGMSLGSS